MATNGQRMDKKRKAAPSTAKGKSADKFKKARTETPKVSKSVPAEDVEDSDDFSDSEEGGAALDAAVPQSKARKAFDGKSFEKEPGQTSREAHAQQKKLALERKAAKPLADEVHRTKKIWEKLRIKSNVPKEERQKLVDELFTIITGRMRDFVLKHDAVRAVQTALKYSTAPRRKQIAKELQGTYAQLAESRYAKFLIGKLLVQGDKEIRDMIIPEFYGKVRKLINHPEASWILDDIYRTVATKEQKALLLREWYGPEFTIREMAKAKDENPTAELKQILEDEPNKRGPIMKGLFDMINSLVQKKMTGFTMLHDAMLQYFLSTEPGTDDFNSYTELFKDEDQVDLLKNLAFTRSGSRLMCLLLAHGSAKDRKVLLRAFRDTILMMAGDAYGHIVILTAYDVIDDTKMTSKSIFPELLGEGEETIQQNVIGAANNDHGRLTFLYLLEGLSKSLFPPGRSYALDVLNEVHEIRKTTSKKPNDQRRSELAAALSPQLLSVVAAAPTELTATSHGCQFVADVLLTCVGDKQAPLEAIAGIAAGDPNEETNEENTAHSSVHISKTAFGSRMLKLLIQGGRFDSEAGKVIPVDPPLNFSNLLYPEIKDHVVDWATGPGSFVIVGLVEANDFNDVDALKKTLKKNKKLLEKAATEMTAEQKQAKETEDQEQKPAKKGKKEKPVGNVGSKILLEAI